MILLLLLCIGVMSLQQETKYWFSIPDDLLFWTNQSQYEVQGTNQRRGNCESSGPLQSGATGGLCAGVSPKLNMDSFTISDILRFTDMDISRFIPDPRR